MADGGPVMPGRAGRVLQVLGPSTGGMRRHVAALAEGLRERGWEVTVAGPAGVLADLDAVVPVPSGPSPLGLRRAARALAAIVPGHDLVHAHGWKAGWTTVAARPGAVPMVVTVHNLILDEVDHWRAPLLRRLEAGLVARADHVIAVAPDIARHVARRAAGRVSIVEPVGPPPVPRRSAGAVRAALGIGAESPLVVTVARLHPQKGLGTLLEAAGLLHERLPAARVVIVGEGPDEARLRARVGVLGLGEVVTLAGPSPNAADELAAADVVAVPSIWESGPLVAAEALLLARPLVATPVGFVPELLTDGRSGRLVPVADAAALASALADVLADPVGAARLGAAGYQRVTEVLGRDRLVDGVVAAYRATLPAVGPAS